MGVALFREGIPRILCQCLVSARWPHAAAMTGSHVLSASECSRSGYRERSLAGLRDELQHGQLADPTGNLSSCPGLTPSSSSSSLSL